MVFAAILGNDNRLLAVNRRVTDRWEPPGGYVERAETIDEAVKRTVWEATGLLVRPVILTGVYTDLGRNEVALVFRCSLIGKDVDRRVNGARGRWLTADEVHRLMDAPSAERLLDAVRLGPPKIRSYDGVRLADDPSLRPALPPQGIADHEDGVDRAEQRGGPAILDS
ncbi:MAG TPA: NUDIX hydrolase [Acidimicrobiales bacterium]|nr:NUDIX hydrolase [Acidimicrobiales bacterium]